MSLPIILVIEDQKSMADLLKQNLHRQIDCEVVTAYNYQEAKAIIESDIDILVCITDLNLPDAPEGATVPLLHKYHITTVVLTANYTEETRQKMFEERVADYVIKDGLSAIQYAVQTVVNLVENSNHLIWVLSPATKNSRRLLGLLNIHRYRVAMFESEEEMNALFKSKVPDLIILNETSKLADFSSVSLIQKLRSQYSQSQLPVLLSEEGGNITDMIMLMKYGVNDFYNLKFTVEELYVRLQLNISLAKSFRQIEKISQTDYLTGLYNRRYLFNCAQKSAELAPRNFSVMMDIDNFKMVNDTYGHSIGDKAIAFTAQEIKKVFSDFMVARFGGEEFCVYGENVDIESVLTLCEQVRLQIEASSKTSTGVGFTVSIGVAENITSLDNLISKADKALYQAKAEGKNKVVALLE